MERIAREIRRQVKREDTLRGVLRALAGPGSLEDRLAEALAGLSRLLSFEAFELLFPDPAGGTSWTELRADRGALSGGGGFSRREVGHPGGSDSPFSRALLLRGPISVDRFGTTGDGRLPEGYDTSLTVPLLSGAEVCGLMAVYSRRSGNFAHGDIGLLQQFGDLLTLALERQRAAENRDHDGEMAGALARHFPAVSACSRASRYLADLETGLKAVFGLDAVRLHRLQSRAGGLDLIELPTGTVPAEGPSADGRRRVLSADEAVGFEGGELRVIEPRRGAEAPHRAPATVLLPLRVEGEPAWLVSASGDPVLLGEPGTLALLSLWRTIVEQALSGMEVCRRLRAEQARLGGMLSLAKVLTELSPESGVFHVVIDKAGELLDFDDCTLYLLDGGEFGLVPVVSSEAPGPDGNPAGAGDRRREWLRSVLDVGEPRLLNDCGPAGGAEEHLMASPMLHKGRPFGIFCLRRSGGRPFTDEELTLLSTLAGFTADVMHRSLEQQKQRELHRTLRLVEENAGEGLVLLDGELRVLRANREAQRLLGVAPGELLGAPLTGRLFRNEDEAANLVLDLESGKQVNAFRTYARPASDAPLPVEVTAALCDADDGAAGGLVLVLRDAGGQLRLEKRLRQATVTDPLTGLRNRDQAYPALAAELERGLRRDRFLSALIFRVRDLERFYVRQGWPAGDRMVRKVGGIVSRRIRGHMDAAFRFGDGTFLVIMPDTPGGDARAAADRILAGLDELFKGRIEVASAVTQSRFADTADSILKRLFGRLDASETVVPDPDR